jgi:hypothetical protein
MILGFGVGCTEMKVYSEHPGIAGCLFFLEMIGTKDVLRGNTLAKQRRSRGESDA